MKILTFFSSYVFPAILFLMLHSCALKNNVPSNKSTIHDYSSYNDLLTENFSFFLINPEYSSLVYLNNSNEVVFYCAPNDKIAVLKTKILDEKGKTGYAINKVEKLAFDSQSETISYILKAIEPDNVFEVTIANSKHYVTKHKLTTK
jgi:hypothetical protein